MTKEEAIVIIKGHKIHSLGHNNDWPEAFDMAVESLEKQIPKKPLKREIAGVDAHLCECGEVIYPSEYFCAYCGQAIDWSEDENAL